MLRIVIVIISLLIFTPPIEAQNSSNWTTYDNAAYRMIYPNSWQLDETGRNKTEFIILSKREKEDPFRENINLIAQDLSNQIMNLESYVALSVDQIKNVVAESKIFESKVITKNGGPVHSIVWSGLLNGKKLKFKQLLFINDNIAYALTLTCEEKEYDNYIETADQILNSFILKK